MEVKAGYKQTEYGTIPEDWGLMELRNIAKYRRGSFPQPYGLSKWYDDISGNPFIQVVDVTDEMKLKPETKKRLSTEAEKMSVFAKKGSVIISLNGSVGRVALTHYDGFIDRTLLLFESYLVLIDKYYFIYALSAVFREEEKKAPGAILKTITKEHLSNFLLPLPKIAEQEAIGEALGDADAFIEALEQLITKKRQIKQGVMQELLTGERRLSGFSGEWEEKSLLELAEGKKELFDDGDWIEAEHITDEGVRLIQTGNIGIGKFVEKDDKKYIFPSSFVSLHCKELRQGDLLICRLAEPAGRACVFPDIGDAKVITSVDVTIFRPPASIANRVFLANIFSTNQWFREVNDKSGGTTHKRISRGSLGRIKIKLPHIDEQTAIAETLSDMDAEISALEEKLSKAQEIKAGMMSVLLTGRIRLVES